MLEKGFHVDIGINLPNYLVPEKKGSPKMLNAQGVGDACTFVCVCTVCRTALSFSSISVIIVFYSETFC
jgi:hypothetical protein